MSEEKTTPVTKPVHRGYRLFALLLALVATIAFSLRVSLPLITHYHSSIEKSVSDAIGKPLIIGNIKTHWAGWSPELSLENVTINPGDARSSLNLKQIDVRPGILKSIIASSIIVDRLAISGALLNIEQDKNGHFSLTAFGSESEGTESSDELKKWLFTQNHLQLKDSTVIWHDALSGKKPFNLKHVHLNLRNLNNRHQIDGHLNFGDKTSANISFALDVNGDLLSTEWSGSSFIHINKLKYEHIGFLNKTLKKLPVKNSVLNAKIWSDWKHAKLTSATSKFSLENITLDDKAHEKNSTGIKASVFLNRQTPNWHVALENINISNKNKVVVKGNGEFLIDLPKQHIKAVAGNFETIDLKQLTYLLAPLKQFQQPLAQKIAAIKTQGRLSQLSFFYQPDSLNKTFEIETRLSKIGLSSIKNKPGFAGLSGQLSIRDGHSNFSIEDSHLVLLLPEKFSKPVDAGIFNGRLSWQISPLWQLNILALSIDRKGMTANVNGFIKENPQRTSPFAFISATMKGADIRHVPDFLPDRILHPSVTEWLNNAFVKGDIEEADVLLHGYLDEFPFDNNQGTFDINATARDVTLFYEAGWPVLNSVDGKVQFNGRSMDIQLQQGRVFDAELKNVIATAADLSIKEPVLVVKGQALGSAKTGLRFLKESPLNKKFADLLNGTQISGNLTTDLEIKIPMSNRPNSVNGTVQLKNNNVHVEQLTLDLNKVEGPLQFTELSMQAKNLTARLADIPVQVKLGNTNDSKSSIIRMDVSGKINNDSLKKILKNQAAGFNEAAQKLVAILQGETDWNATVDLRIDNNSKKPVVPILRVNSDLLGMEIKLPSPLGKTASEAVPLKLITQLTNNPAQNLNISLQNRLNGNLHFDQKNNKKQLTKGTLYLGSATGEQSSENGLTIIGALDTFSVTNWLSLFPEDNTGKPVNKSFLRSINLSADRFEMFGQWHNNMTLRAHQQSDAQWAIDINSAGLSGIILIPASLTDKPVIIQMERLSLNSKNENKNSPPPDPRQLPSMLLTAESLTLDDYSLGRADIKISQYSDGLTVDSLTLNDDHFNVTAKGNWSFDGNEHISNFNIDIESDDIGLMLSTMGYERKAFEGGDASFSIDASWKGAPMDFSLAKLNGTSHFTAKNGRLIDLEPGAGRMFGLISLQALPRRLKLDFSDVFSSGFIYDLIDGNFTIDAGNAYTNNLYMLAPSARIDVAGRIGLATEDYDQLVTVSPDVSSTLVLSGAVAGGPVGAAIGAAASLIARTLFKNQVEEVVNQQYQVTGSWDNPDVEPIQPQKDEDNE